MSDVSMWGKISLFLLSGPLLTPYQPSTLVFTNFTWSAEISKSQIFTFWFSKKTCRGHLITKGMVTPHVFSNFQVPRNIPEKKIMQKNLILHFFVMSAFEMEKINTSLILVFIPSSLVLSMFSQFQCIYNCTSLNAQL